MKALKLTTLEERRLRGDLIQQFKISKGYDLIDLKNSQKTHSIRTDGPASNIRGHSHRINAEFTANFSSREHFFSNRVPFAWNKLPEKVINSTSINSFKANLGHIDLWSI